MPTEMERSRSPSSSQPPSARCAIYRSIYTYVCVCIGVCIYIDVYGKGKSTIVFTATKREV